MEICRQFKSKKMGIPNCGYVDTKIRYTGSYETKGRLDDMHGDNEMILDLDSIKSTGLSAIVVNKGGTTKKMYP